ncbi:hypothetical protein ACFFQF_26330 [Haladaptatus pallidirubidus]|uniref:hypothetical protein n=1 Tax=Haladaptatus pallidirubidus TaxID=1008152 RepID=UPI0035ECC28D
MNVERRNGTALHRGFLSIGRVLADMRVTPALLVACLVVCSGCMGLGIDSEGTMQSNDRSGNQSGDRSVTAGTSTTAMTDAKENVSAAFVADGERTNVTLKWQIRRTNAHRD